MERLVLKKEVKETLIIMLLLIISILLMIWIGKSNEKAYEDCMSKHNDKNFCHKLIEF